MHGEFWFKQEIIIAVFSCTEINGGENQRGPIKNGQSRNTGNIGYPIHRTKTNKAKDAIQKTKKMSNTDPLKKVVNTGVCVG